ncbi:MAG: hypothetical protein ABIG85_00030, partial [Chloroflexota bacterium]
MRSGQTVGRGRRVIALTVFLVALALAGCGATPSASPVATATPGASATPSGPAPSATPLPPGAFTFDLPVGWTAVPVAGSHDVLLATLRSQNAAFAESLAARLENLSDTTTYLAFDASPAAVTKGDLATLVVTEVALPLDVSLQTFARTIQGQVRQLVEGDVELREILVTAGQAYSMAYTAPLTRPDGQPAAAAVTQVLYVLPGRGYVITFAVPPARANDYSQVVADIATSF